MSKAGLVGKGKTSLADEKDFFAQLQSYLNRFKQAVEDGIEFLELRNIIQTFYTDGYL